MEGFPLSLSPLLDAQNRFLGFLFFCQILSVKTEKKTVIKKLDSFIVFTMKYLLSAAKIYLLVRVSYSLHLLMWSKNSLPCCLDSTHSMVLTVVGQSYQGILGNCKNDLKGSYGTIVYSSFSLCFAVSMISVALFTIDQWTTCYDELP